MANNKKGKFVTLGARAFSFYDASTGIFIGKGDKKELTTRQLNSPKIRKALHAGHLQYVAEDNKVPKFTQEDLEKLIARFQDMVEKGMEPAKIAKAFSDEEVDKIADNWGLTRDKGEKSIDVITTIISELENPKAE